MKIDRAGAPRKRSSRGEVALRLAAGVLLLISAVPTAGIADATVRSGAAIVVAAGTETIKGRYIVVLTGHRSIGASAVRRSALELTGRYGGTVTRTFDAVDGFAVKASEKQARALAAHPDVAYVEHDRVLKVGTTGPGTQPAAPWGLDRIDQRRLPLDGSYTYDTDGSGVTAYVIGTGIRTSHVDFGGRASVGVDQIGDGRNGQDGNGHGTHVAGTIGGTTHGVAKGVKLVAVRVLDDAGSGTLSGVIAGIDWVTKNAARPAVAEMTVGGSASQTLDDAVRRSIAAGITYTVIAGAESTDASHFSPARVGEAITVGATDKTDSRTAFSNYGSVLDLFAPGSGITSAWNTGDTATVTLSGTSSASAHAAGVAALYLAVHGSASAAQVRDALVACATPGVVTTPGSGSPNKLLYSRGGG